MHHATPPLRASLPLERPPRPHIVRQPTGELPAPPRDATQATLVLPWRRSRADEPMRPPTPEPNPLCRPALGCARRPPERDPGERERREREETLSGGRRLRCQREAEDV